MLVLDPDSYDGWMFMLMPLALTILVNCMESRAGASKWFTAIALLPVMAVCMSISTVFYAAFNLSDTGWLPPIHPYILVVATLWFLLTVVMFTVLHWLRRLAPS